MTRLIIYTTSAAQTAAQTAAHPKRLRQVLAARAHEDHPTVHRLPLNI